MCPGQGPRSCHHQGAEPALGMRSFQIGYQTRSAGPQTPPQNLGGLVFQGTCALKAPQGTGVPQTPRASSMALVSVAPQRGGGPTAPHSPSATAWLGPALWCHTSSSEVSAPWLVAFPRVWGPVLASGDPWAPTPAAPGHTGKAGQWDPAS